MKIGDLVNCRIGLFGDVGYKSSVPVKIKDITKNKKGDKEYWFQELGLCVIGIAKKREIGANRLYSGRGSYVAYAGQRLAIKGVITEVDALAYLGYGAS